MNHYYSTGTVSAMCDIWFRYKDVAKRRGHEWTLTRKQFEKIIVSNCYYCGSEPRGVQRTRSISKTAENLRYTGIDRLNSKRGYTVRNSVPCCMHCNYGKGQLSKQQFLDHVSKIYHYQNGLE